MYQYHFIVNNIQHRPYRRIKGIYVSKDKVSQWFTKIDLISAILHGLHNERLIEITSELPTVTVELEDMGRGHIVITAIN